MRKSVRIGREIDGRFCNHVRVKTINRNLEFFFPIAIVNGPGVFIFYQTFDEICKYYKLN